MLIQQVQNTQIMSAVTHGNGDGSSCQIFKVLDIEVLSGHKRAFMSVADIYHPNTFPLLAQDDREGGDHERSLNLIVSQGFGHLGKGRKFDRFETEIFSIVGGMVQEWRRQIGNHGHVPEVCEPLTARCPHSNRNAARR